MLFESVIKSRTSFPASLFAEGSSTEPIDRVGTELNALSVENHIPRIDACIYAYSTFVLGMPEARAVKPLRILSSTSHILVEFAYIITSRFMLALSIAR